MDWRRLERDPMPCERPPSGSDAVERRHRCARRSTASACSPNPALPLTTSGSFVLGSWQVSLPESTQSTLHYPQPNPELDQVISATFSWSSNSHPRAMPKVTMRATPRTNAVNTDNATFISTNNPSPLLPPPSSPIPQRRSPQARSRARQTSSSAPCPNNRAAGQPALPTAPTP